MLPDVPPGSAEEGAALSLDDALEYAVTGRRAALTR